MSDFALSSLSRDLGAVIASGGVRGEASDLDGKPSISSSSSKGPVLLEASVQAPLETFFPFDPCYLISLHQYIDKFYRPWRGIPGINGDGSSVDALSHIDEEEASSYIMSTADGKQQQNHSTSVSSSNMSSTASHSYFNKEYGMSGLSNVTFSMHARSLHENVDMAVSIPKSTNFSSAASDGEDHGSKTAPMRRPRQYSISSTGSW